MAELINFPDQPIFLDLIARSGDSFGPNLIRILDADGDPVDLTDYDVKVNFGPCVTRKTTDGTLALDDPTTGEVLLYLPQSDVLRFGDRREVPWELKLSPKVEDASEPEFIRTLFEGRILIQAGLDR